MRHMQLSSLICQLTVFSILTDFVLAAFPLLLLWNMRLPGRQKVQLNCLLGLGIITAMACIGRTIFSYEIKQPDVTWQGVPNAICRMLEINFGIIAACVPVMRTLFISMKKQYKDRGSESLSSTRTPASQLQWYAPPTQTPWYMRVKRSLWHPPPAVDMTNDLHASDSDRSLPKPDMTIEKMPRRPIYQRGSTPLTIPKSHPPLNRGKSLKHYERPENVTWAQNNPLSKTDSLDLPIQGPRQKGWDDEDEDEKSGEQDAGFGTYRFHRNWV